MSRSDLSMRIKQVLVQRFELPMPPHAIADDANVFADGLGLDSMATFDLIGAVEDHFEIDIEDADLILSNFETVAAIARLIESKRAGIAQ